MTSNRVKVVFLQTGTEPSYIMLYKQKINPQTEINTRRAFLDTIVFAMLFLQKYMIVFRFLFLVLFLLFFNENDV